MLLAALLGVNPSVIWLVSPREDRLAPCLHLGRLSIHIIMGQQGPDHPGVFVGQGHRGDISAFAAFERPQPPPLRINPPFGTLHDGARTMNQEHPHMPTASFRKPT